MLKLIDQKIFTILPLFDLMALCVLGMVRRKMEAHLKIMIFISSSQIYVVGTQKNRLDETVLLTTLNKC